MKWAGALVRHGRPFNTNASAEIHVVSSPVSRASTRSAVMGNSVTGRPTARATAFITAAGVGVIAGSPMPLAPNGPRPLPDSIRMVSTAGESSVVGIL